MVKLSTSFTTQNTKTEQKIKAKKFDESNMILKESQGL